MEDFGEASFDLQFLFDNSNEHVNADCDPDLGPHGARRRAIKGFNSQMLFDPFEEQFDLPAALVELRDRQHRQHKVVRQKDKFVCRFRRRSNGSSATVRSTIATTRTRVKAIDWSLRSPDTLSMGCDCKRS